MTVLQLLYSQRISVLFAVVALCLIFGHSLDILLNVGTILFMVMKDIKKSYVLLDAVRLVYAISDHRIN
jgi:hypothetical protein